MKLQLIQRIELCVNDVLFEIEGTVKGNQIWNEF